MRVSEQIMNSDTINLKKESLTSLNSITFRKPTLADGAPVHALIARCAPLDTNSMYCNLLQCFHFADSAILAELEQQPVGFISGYIVPNQPDTLFVWQVAVDAQARGQGLASRMLTTLLANQNSSVRYLHTTITADNQASWNTFRRLARALETDFTSQELFNKEQHLGGQHDTEFLIQIGPFSLNK